MMKKKQFERPKQQRTLQSFQPMIQKQINASIRAFEANANANKEKKRKYRYLIFDDKRMILNQRQSRSKDKYLGSSQSSVHSSSDSIRIHKVKSSLQERQKDKNMLHNSIQKRQNYRYRNYQESRAIQQSSLTSTVAKQGLKDQHNQKERVIASFFQLQNSIVQIKKEDEFVESVYRQNLAKFYSHKMRQLMQKNKKAASKILFMWCCNFLRSNYKFCILKIQRKGV